MIQMQSGLSVADNSGAKTVKCIKVLGGSKKMLASVGDLIKVSVTSAIPRSKVKKGEVYLAVVVRTAYNIRRDDMSVVKFLRLLGCRLLSHKTASSSWLNWICSSDKPFRFKNSTFCWKDELATLGFVKNLIAWSNSVDVSFNPSSFFSIWKAFSSKITRSSELKGVLVDKKHFSISGIAHEAGFKSQASFYRIFKKHTGVTPSQFIEQHQHSV